MVNKKILGYALKTVIVLKTVSTVTGILGDGVGNLLKLTVGEK